MVFGATLSPLNLWLRFAVRCLLSVLKKEPLARISTPTQTKADAYVNSIGAKYHLLGEEHVALALDGLKITVQKSRCDIRQNAFYNGWTSDHYILNVFVFAPDGRIVAMIVNAPGAMHDSTLMDMSGMYEKLKVWFIILGIKSVVDSAFQTSTSPFLIKSAQLPNASDDI